MFNELEFPTEESRKIAFQLGVLCMRWAEMDRALGMAIGRYFDLSTHHLELPVSLFDVSKKIQIAKYISFSKDDSTDASRFEIALNFIDNVMKPLRNRYVHDNYSFIRGDGVRYEYQTMLKKYGSFKNKELKIKSTKKITFNELHDFCNDISILIHYLYIHTFNLINKEARLEHSQPMPETEWERTIRLIQEDLNYRLQLMISKYNSRNSESQSTASAPSRPSNRERRNAAPR